MKKRLLSWLLVLTMVISLVPSTLVTALAAGDGVDIPSDDTGYTAIYDVSSGNAASLVDGGTYKLTGLATNYQITVPDNANVTLVLDNVTITHTRSPLVLGQKSTATLVLLDRTGNSLICTATDASSNQTAGVLVPDTAKLIVDSPSGSAGTGVLNVTGGYGGAGIGGSAASGYGNTRNNNGVDAYIWNQPGYRAQGGQGGRNGIDAAAAGTITINAGTVNATGGQGGAGIGGGMGATGENGAMGAPCGEYNYLGQNWHSHTGGSGGGAGGNGGRGGRGGTVTINGGKLLAVGKHGSGASQNPVVVDGRYPAYNTGFNLYANSSKGYGPCDGGRAGEGGTAIQPTVTVVQTQIKIANSNNNVRFLDSNNRDVSVGSQPTDQLSTPLYQVALTVRNKADDTLVSNANVAVAVNKDDTARKYSYKTVSDDNGIATLWLPKGEYILTYFDVSRNDVGIIQQGDGVTLNVEENNNNAAEVKIGLDMTASASIPNSSKVYINDTTTVDGAPSSIKIDTTKTHDSQLGDITWFREPVNGNTQDYALYQTVSLPGFDTGFTNVTNSDDKGTLTVTPGTKQAELKVLENGRYWLKIPMTVTDPNDTSKSMTVNLIRLVEVKNIYREYSIQVKSVELDKNGDPKGNPDYAPLKTALGTNYAGSYGFAWDLNGYQSQTLLKNPSAGFDTVQINGLNSKVKWYNANFGTQNTLMNKNAAKTGFEPITLTLDQGFLTANKDADKGADGQTDPTKYTITYTPEGVPVAEVTIRGVVLNDDGTELKELWSYDNSYPEGVTEATINGFKQDGYRIDKVLVNGTERAGVTLTGNSIHLTDLQGTQENNYTDAIEKVEFVYVNNMVDVTVKAMYNGKELQSTTISLEKGVQMTVSAPSIEGYTADEASQTYTPVDGANTIMFQYTKDAGNVTVVAVDQNGNTEIYRKDGGTVARGGSIDLTGDAKAPTIEYYTTPSAPKSVTVNGVAVADLDAYTYNGVGDIVVTYEYTRKTQDITIVKKDVATGGKIEEQPLKNLSVGESHTFIAGKVTVPANYEAAADRNPTTYFVEDKADQTVTFWYKNTSDSQYAQVTVNLTCDGEIFQTYPVTAVKGVLTTIKAPDVRGYNIDGDAAKSITPTGVDDVVEFTYTINNLKTVKVELKTNSDAANPDTKLTAPIGYTESYTLKDGDSITIWAPTLEGYALRGATLNGTGQTDMQPVAVDYANLPNGTSTVVFRYLPVAQANFVTHTIKFMLGTQKLYSYEKMVAKGTGNQVSYPKDAVADMVPGYVYSETTYEVGGVTVSAEAVKDNANAVIIYHFKEDTAQITIKFQDADGNQLTSGGVAMADQVLTGYRKGQTIEVPAPVLNGFALAPNEDLIKTVNLSATEANTEVAFKYVPLANTYFILKEKLADGTEKIITFINAKENTKYDPNEPGNPLDLSGFGYSFTTDTDKVGTDVSNEFAAGGAGSVTTGVTLDSKTYTLYYVKGVRSVKFVPVDKDKLDAAQKALDEVIQDGTVDTYKIDGLTPAAMEDARIGETYKASAQSFNGWALKDDFTKLYKVETGNGPLKVYFLYAAKSLGDVTVHYHFGDSHNAGKLLNEYTIKAVVGEKVSISAPSYLMDNKYHLREGQTNTYVLEVTNNTKEVEFYYEANFVVVTAKTVVDGGTATAHETYEVIKDLTTHSGSTTLYPPEKAGYTLIGIDATGATLTDGGADKLPNEYTNNKLDLKGLTTDATVTYYYKTTKASEYQTELTVEYKYNGYDLATAKKINANTGEANSIDIPAFDGYKASTYDFKDGSKAPVTGADISGTTVSVTPAEKTATLTITYTRPDGSIVLPGEDGKFPAPDDKDNVIVKPGTGTTITGPETDGSVKIPEDGTGTVTRPDPDNKPDGKEDIKVPGGTVIKPDGTIELPGGGGTIKPEDKLPEKTPDGYISVIYKANGGSGDDVICLVKNDAAITAIKNPFSNGNQAFKYWNTKENGVGGTIYREGDAINGITGKSVTLYAQWGKSTTFKYSAKLIYLPNDGSGEANKIEDTVGTNGTNPFSENLRAANTFTVAGWTFGGWNTAANGTGTLKTANAIVEVTANQNQTWHAQWYKVNADGSITVPGKDGNPNTAEDTTANGNGKKNPERDDATGNIKVPEGGSVTLPDGTVIGMPDGGILKPDGTVIITRPGGGTITIPGKTDPTKPDVTDKDGNEEKNPEVVTMTYHSNDGTDKVVNVKVVKGEKISIIASPFTWNGYNFLNWMGTDKQEYNPDDEFEAREMEFFAQWYKKDDSTDGNGSIELPGKDGAIEPPHDKDNIIVTPDQKDGLTGPNTPDGSVDVVNGGATVTRPDPTDPKFPNGSKEDIKVPEGSTVYPDGTIRLPDGTIIKPEDKYPTEVIPKDYVIVTYEPNGGNGNVVHQMVKINEATAVLAGTSFTAPRNQEFEKWLDAASGKSYVEGDKITAAQDVTLTAQWKTKATTPTTYSATVVLVPNTGDASFTQTLTSMSSQMVSGALDAYADHFTAPEGWTFMGWSTAKAASQNATFYENGTTVTLRSGTSMTLYAILYKVEDTGVVKLPGADGEPNGVDDVTVTPAEGSAITPGKGYMEAPKDSQIKQPAGTITVIEGTVKVYPDGSVFVPDGSKVIDKAGNTITGPATIDKDGKTDVDNTKPIQKPDGTIVLPGTNGKIGDEDDIIIKPAGPNTPAGRIDGNGNVTITNPDGADVTIPGNTPADVKVPNGTVITPDGKVTLLYTIRYVDRSGNELRPADQRPLAVGAQQNVKAREIAGYTVASAPIITITAALSENLSDYTIDFVYARNATTILTLSIDPNNVTAYAGDTVSFTAYVNGVPSNLVYWSVDSQKSTISNGVLTVGSDETSGAVLNVRAEAMDNTAVFDTATVTIRARSTPVGPTEPGKPNQPTNPSIDPSKNPATGVTLPEYTGVAKWLETENHIAYMSGVGAGRFEPNANMTRAQVAQMFYNLLKDKGIAVTASFSDVPSDKWYSEAVNALASLGIIQGSNGKFRPNDPITRAEFVAIAMRFADTVRGARASFTDVSTSAWYYDSIASAVSYGWIGGYSDGSFRPTKPITRAEVVTIVNRMLDRSFDSSVSIGFVTNFSDVPVTHWAFGAISEATTSHDHTSNNGVESWR